MTMEKAGGQYRSWDLNAWIPEGMQDWGTRHLLGLQGRGQADAIDFP